MEPPSSKRIRPSPDLEEGTKANINGSSPNTEVCQSVDKELETSQPSGPDAEEISDESGGDLLILTSCSPYKVQSVLSSLPPAAKEIVKEVGLGGLLDLPSITFLDRRFSAWLLTRVWTMVLSLELGNGHPVSLDYKSVELVLGISSDGQQVPFDLPSPDRKLYRSLAKVLQLPSDITHITAVDIEEVLRRHLNEPLTEDEKDMIRSAVVIFCCTYLLAPHHKSPHIPVEILHIALHPRTLKQYNWASYVLEKIRQSSYRLINDFRNHRQCVTVGGCLLYLQIMYLDHVDFGDLNVQANIYPRATAYTEEKLQQLIQLDKAQPELPCSIIYGMVQTTRLDSPSDPGGRHGQAELARKKWVLQANTSKTYDLEPEDDNSVREVIAAEALKQIDEFAAKTKKTLGKLEKELQSENSRRYVQTEIAIHNSIESTRLQFEERIAQLRDDIMVTLAELLDKAM